MPHLFQQIFYFVVIIGSVGINDRSRWQSKGVILQGIDITKASMGEKKLDRLPIFGDQSVDFQSIEIPFLAGEIATKLLLRIQRIAFNSKVITDSNW